MTPPANTASVILGNGWVLPLDGTRHQAVAFRGSRIVHVGSVDDARARLPDAQFVDLDGAVVIPGITDSHTHFKRASAFLAMYLDFGALAPTSIQEVRDAVADRVEIEPPGAWIQGDGLAPSALVEERFPTRAELDTVAPANPVVLRSVGRHVVAANSLALEAAGIDSSTPDPVGGRLERDADGTPTGVLHEEAKLRLDANRSDTVIPPETAKDRLAALSRSVDMLGANGIVAIHEMPRDPDQISDWLQLRETEPPRVRVRFYIRGLAARTNYQDVLGAGLRSGFGDEWLRLGGIKFSLDGAGAYGNAMTYDPYPGQPDNYGLQRIDEGDLREGIRLCHDGGLQIAVHAIGPRAVDMTLDAFESLGVPGPDLAARRHRIEHAYLPGPSGQLDRIARSGLVLSTQPAALRAVGDAWRKHFDDDEMVGAMPLRQALDLNTPLQLNSDFPCAALNPFVGVRSAVDRMSDAGVVLDATQSIDAMTALLHMTRTPAWTAFEDGWRGRLAEGYAADLVVLDDDPTTCATEALTAVSVLRTVVGGSTVFEA